MKNVLKVIMVLVAIASVVMVNAQTVLAAEIEPLHGLFLTKTSSTITVTSTGCTEKKSFETILEESKPPVATFIRVHPDPCEATPHKVNIEFSYHEVGADKFKIANPFVPDPEL